VAVATKATATAVVVAAVGAVALAATGDLLVVNMEELS